MSNNTDKLIPISYVKKFTPLVAGDVLFYNDGGYSFTLPNENNAALYNEDDADENFSLVSFADRPSTGTQPVGDDVVVDLKYLGKWNEYESIEGLSWNLGDNVSAWKPNHAAMLEQYHAEQVEKTKKDIMNVLIDSNDSGLEINMISHDDMVAKLDKPVFTQAMKDAGELPQINDKFLVGEIKGCARLLEFNGLEVTVISIGLAPGGGDVITFSHPVFGIAAGVVGEWVIPIDNRTPERKLYELIYDAVYDDDISDDLNQQLAVELMNNDKFTITLNS